MTSVCLLYSYVTRCLVSEWGCQMCSRRTYRETQHLDPNPLQTHTSPVADPHEPTHPSMFTRFAVNYIILCFTLLTSSAPQTSFSYVSALSSTSAREQRLPPPLSPSPLLFTRS
jgi:hypothetical protein